MPKRVISCECWGVLTVVVHRGEDFLHHGLIRQRTSTAAALLRLGLRHRCALLAVAVVVVEWVGQERRKHLLAP